MYLSLASVSVDRANRLTNEIRRFSRIIISSNTLADELMKGSGLYRRGGTQELNDSVLLPPEHKEKKSTP